MLLTKAVTHVAIEILIGVLVAVLAVATTLAALIGLAGMLGAVRLIRCEHCNRFGVASSTEQLTSCLKCRHERMLHPIAARHRRWSDGSADSHTPNHA